VGFAIGLTALNAWDQQQNRTLAIGTTWTNPITLVSADVPPGWFVSQERNDQGQPVYTFTAPSEHLVAVFGMEENPNNITVTQYFGLLVKAVAGSMVIGANLTSQTVGGRQVLLSEGHLTQEPNRKLQISLVGNRKQFWRFVVVGGSGRKIDDRKANELRDGLFRTVER